MLIYLGNANVATANPDTVATSADTDAPDVAQEAATGGESVTYVETPDSLGPIDAISAVVAMWSSHSAQPPSWVACDDAPTASLLSRQFGCDEKTVEQAVAEYNDAAGVQDS